MPFKITIVETKEVIATTGKEWAEVDTEEVERESLLYEGTDAPKTRIKPVYGYTPEVEKKVTVTREILSQCVDELDLVRVIRAINGIED